jgi:polysaccharide biosynthesis protein PslA
MEWQYRLIGVGGVIVLTMLAVVTANLEPIQYVFTTYVPRFNNLPVTVMTGRDLLIALALTTAVVASSMIPLYKPQQRRIPDTIVLTQKRVLIATFLLATIGYFDWEYRLPRATLVMTSGLLMVALPAWFSLIRDHATKSGSRAIVVGRDSEEIERVFSAADVPIVGYLSPLQRLDPPAIPVADGGADNAKSARIGGLSQMERVLREDDIDTVFLAFSDADHRDFFNTLAICYDYGVRAKTLEEHEENVLFVGNSDGTLITVDLEPWDWQDQVLKRLFDIAFAAVGLIMSAPLFVVIAIAIKLDSSGPVFYVQNRTTGFGETFAVPKFRTMRPESESVDPIDGKDDRITRVGRILRESHLDELPQLISILRGDMSAVGPRAVWTDEENVFESDISGWRKRWFVKPGLTGLAQVNDVSSTEPRTKLEYDIEYIRNQSFWFDVNIVAREIWNTLFDVYTLIRDDTEDEDGSDDQ